MKRAGHMEHVKTTVSTHDCMLEGKTLRNAMHISPIHLWILKKTG